MIFNVDNKKIKNISYNDSLEPEFSMEVDHVEKNHF